MIKLEVPSVPHLVHIETTYSCNGKCIFCYNPRRGEGFNKTKIDAIVKSVYDSHVPHVYLIGGEPSILGVEQLNEYINLLAERSSVTIVTNGLICLKGISSKLACIGIPIHGNEETHEKHTGIKGGYKRAIATAKYYIGRGFDVRCIPVLTAWNYDQMYDVIKLAKELGMESVFVDRYEDGGIGSIHSEELKPSAEQFKVALNQMIIARDELFIPVGFGTAIPYCIDERLLEENICANCGAGVTFCAISPDGNVRVCNQSENVYGNVLEEPLEDIWNKKGLDDFRDLSWVNEPCSSCSFLSDCMCGCKVDATCSSGYCIDYAVRGQKKENLHLRTELPMVQDKSGYPDKYRIFTPDMYTRLNEFHPEKYLVTRYQTIKLNDVAVEIMGEIIKGETSEENLVKRFEDMADECEVRSFLTNLSSVNAINFT